MADQCTYLIEPLRALEALSGHLGSRTFKAVGVKTLNLPVPKNISTFKNIYQVERGSESVDIMSWANGYTNRIWGSSLGQAIHLAVI